MFFNPLDGYFEHFLLRPPQLFKINNDNKKKIRKEAQKKTFCGPSKFTKIFHGLSIYA